MSRVCGSCTACCHGLVIQELGKPAFQDCQHACATGCNRYTSRPSSCRNFECLWLQGHLTEADRPDKLGVIFTTAMHDTLGTVPLLVEVRPGAAQQVCVKQAVARMTVKTDVIVSTRDTGKFYHRSAPADVTLTVGGKAA